LLKKFNFNFIKKTSDIGSEILFRHKIEHLFTEQQSGSNKALSLDPHFSLDSPLTFRTVLSTAWVWQGNSVMELGPPADAALLMFSSILGSLPLLVTSLLF